MPRHPRPSLKGALRALAPLSPAQRRWLLATDGAVEAGLTPAGLAAAATWSHTEAMSTEALTALMPDAVVMTPPADVPGSALVVDIAHLYVPYSSVNGITTGLVTTTVRFWVYQHTPDGPAAVPTGGPHTAYSSGRYASPLPIAPCSIDLGRFLFDEASGELYYRARLAGALSIKRVSPNQERGRGARTRTFSLFEPSAASAADGVPGVSVSHMVIEDTPLLSRGPSGRLRVGGGGGQGVYGDWGNRALTSVIDFSGFSTALGRMAGLFGACIKGSLSGRDISSRDDGDRRGGAFPIHTCDTIAPLEEVWGAPRPRGGTGFGGDELASVVAVVAAAVTHPGGWAAAWAGTWAGAGEAGGGDRGEKKEAANSFPKPPSVASSVAVAAKSKLTHESALQIRPASTAAAAAAPAVERSPTVNEAPSPVGTTRNRRRNQRRRERAAARRRRAAAAARPPGAIEDTSGIIGEEPAEVKRTAAATAFAVATPGDVPVALADGDAASESDDGCGSRSLGGRDGDDHCPAASAAATRDASCGVVASASHEEVGVDLSARHVRAFADLFAGSEE